jgi:uncharacterized protein YgbK (DUF1537 family)
LYATQTLVIGDDPTGCNLVGAIFNRKNFSALTTWNIESAKALAGNYDVILFDTNSRHLSAARAYAKVAELLEDFGSAMNLAKRIDSTLRGNLGPEVQAIFDSLSANNAATSSPKNVKGLVVSAYPDAQRTTVGGRQFVNGELLSRSAVALDPLNPIIESDVGKLISANSQLTTSYIFLEQVREVPGKLAKIIESKTSDLIIFDTETNADISSIVTALSQVKSSDCNWITIDPGPFTVAYVESQLGRGEAKTLSIPLGKSAFIFAFIGSSSNLTSEQIEYSKTHSIIKWINIDSREKNSESSLQQISLLADAGFTNIGIVVKYPEEITSGTAVTKFHQSEVYLATLAAEIIKSTEPRGIYTSGGDTTLAVLKKLGAHGLHVIDEVFPGAVVGILIGGKFDKMRIITKGGLIGSESGISQSIDYLDQVSFEQAPTIGIESGKS